MPSVASLSAGQSMNYTIYGTATHDGGSCQIALSYDFGSSWNVVYSHIGGCLVEGMTETITIPSDAPSGAALFSWSWFNNQGNREMYQNCASVTITHGGGGLDDLTQYPPPFVANAGVNQCSTEAGMDIVFPHPGANVRYGGVYAGGSGATPGAGRDGSEWAPAERYEWMCRAGSEGVDRWVGICLGRARYKYTYHIGRHIGRDDDGDDGDDGDDDFEGRNRPLPARRPSSQILLAPSSSSTAAPKTCKRKRHFIEPPVEIVARSACARDEPELQARHGVGSGVARTRVKRVAAMKAEFLVARELVEF